VGVIAKLEPNSSTKTSFSARSRTAHSPFSDV